MSFPTNLTNAVDGVTDVVADHLNNLEAKVGIDGSLVATSLDYLLKNPASIEPGHKHSKLWASGGSPEAVTVDAAGNVLIPGSLTTGIININTGHLSYIDFKVNNVSKWQFGLDVTSGSDNDLQFYSDAAGGVLTLMRTGGNVGIGTPNPNTAALLHLSSTTKGFLPPVLTTTQKNAIGSPPAGLVVYDSTLNKLCVYTGAAWQTITSS